MDYDAYQGQNELGDGMDIVCDPLAAGENENEICQKCYKARPDNFPLQQDFDWVGCDRCNKWYHVICMGFTSSEQLADRDFICCEEEEPEENDSAV
jgi:hypothetical protein